MNGSGKFASITGFVKSVAPPDADAAADDDAPGADDEADGDEAGADDEADGPDEPGDAAAPDEPDAPLSPAHAASTTTSASAMVPTRASPRTDELLAWGRATIDARRLLQQPLEQRRGDRAAFRGDVEHRQRDGAAPLAERPDEGGRAVDPADEHSRRHLVAVARRIVAGEDVVGQHLLVREVERVALGQVLERPRQEPREARHPVPLPRAALAGGPRHGVLAQHHRHAAREVLAL